VGKSGLIMGKSGLKKLIMGKSGKKWFNHGKKWFGKVNHVAFLGWWAALMP
jgi:hypothetical protein